MSTFNLEIDTGNAAFDEPEWQFEVARLLRKLADRIENTGDDEGRLLDANGSTVGSFWREE